jgi:hypothetical protein
MDDDGGTSDPHTPLTQSVAVTSDAPDRRGRSWKTALVCGIYVALSFAFFRHAWSHPTSTMQVGGDQFNFTWLLQWTPQAIVHLHNPLFTNDLNYPFGVNLLTNAGAVGLGVLFAPVTWLFGPVASFNAVETLSLAASAIGGYFFALRWVRWRPAAFIAGLLYGFSPYEIAQTGHINLTFVVLPPLIFLMVHEIVVRQSWPARRAGIVLALLCVLQFFVSSELLFDTVIVGAVGVIVTVAFGRRLIRDKVTYAWRAIAWAVGTGAVLLSYPIAFSLAGPAHISGMIQLVPQGYRADLFGLVVPDLHQQLAPSHLAQVASHYANSTSENGSYLGLTLVLVLAVGAVVLWRLAVVRVAAITAVAAFILSLGSGLVVNSAPGASISGFPLPGWILAKLPLVDNAIPARFSLFCVLLSALVLAVILQHLRDITVPRQSAVPRWALPAAVSVFALFPLYPAPMGGITSTGIPQYFTSSAVDRVPVGSVAVVYPYPSTNYPSATLWQAETHLRYRQPGTTLLVPAADGHLAYSADVSFNRDTKTAQVLIGLLNGQVPGETTALRTTLLGEFARWHVQTFIALPAGTVNPGQAVAFFSWLFGRAPVVSAGAAFTWYHLAT